MSPDIPIKQTIYEMFPLLPHTYLVGGCVRDILLDRLPIDYDLVVLKDPEGAARAIAAHTGGHLIQLGKPGLTLYRIISPKAFIDVQEAKGGTIESDLGQRDFTINAMAYRMDSGQIIDVHDGKKDLQHKTVRMTSNQVFITDPVRLIRAYRIAAILGFDLDPRTTSAIQTHGKLITGSAGERIRDELIKLLGVSNAHEYMVEMAESELMFNIFPKLVNLKDCTQNRHHTEPVFAHTLSGLKHLEHLLASPERWLPDLMEPLEAALGDHSKILLKLSILLHDIGKPEAKTMDEQGNIHFYGHEKIGVDILQPIINRLKLSNQDARFIEQVVANHLRPLHLFQAEQQNSLTRKGMIRFFMNCNEFTPAIALHALADQTAKKGETDSAFNRFIHKLLEDFFFNFKTVQSRAKLISGRDLIDNFALSPSPLFKTILQHVEEKRLAGDITTKDEALTQVRQFLRSHNLAQ